MGKRFGWLSAAVLLMILSGCGGGSGGPGSGMNDPGRGEVGTARFHVDVQTGQVSITPLSGDSRSRAVFAGSAVSFESSVLVDQPGNVGRKMLEVSIKNNSGETIGRLVDNTPIGLRVCFSDIVNVASFSDPRPNVTVRTLAGTGTSGSVDGPAAASSFSTPMGVAVGPDGAVYVAEYSNNRIRKIANNLTSTMANLSGSPSAVAISPYDSALFITRSAGNDIVRLDTTGRLTTIAGTGAAGFDDGTSGADAKFSNPTGIAVDTSGAIYVSDTNNSAIRKITRNWGDPADPTSYQVTTLTGNGAGYVDGTLAAARFSAPRQITMDPDGMLYVADLNNNRVRRISPEGNLVSTVAGTGSRGTADGPGNTASFYWPVGIVYTNGALIVSDSGGHTIRQIRLKAPGAEPSRSSSWYVQTLAGLGGTSGFADGTGTEARFNTPYGMAVSPGGNIIISEHVHRIRTLAPNGGTFPVGVTSGSAPAEPVKLWNADGYQPTNNRPYILYDESLYPGATSDHQTWGFIVPSGVTAFEFTVTVEAHTTVGAPPEAGSGAGSKNVSVRTYAGPTSGTAGFLDGVEAQARFAGLNGIAADQKGNLYLADTANHAIRRIDVTGMVTTVAGSRGVVSGKVNDLGNKASFNQPSGIAVSPDGTILYVADTGNHMIRRIALVNPYADPTDAANWNVTTIVNTAGTADKTHGLGDTAKLNGPFGIALDRFGNLYVTEMAGNRVRKVQYRGGLAEDPGNWYVSLLAGDDAGVTGVSGTTDSATGSSARFNAPAQIAVDRVGNLYVADKNNHRIRKITPDGATSTLAGPTGTTLDTGYVDHTTPGSARFNTPVGIAVDEAGFVYVADSVNRRIRRISPLGAVTTVAGTGSEGGADGTGAVATFKNPVGIGVDYGGNLFAADGGATTGTRVRLIQRVISAGTP